MESKRKYGGRWPLDDDEKRSEVIRVRLRKDEIEKIKKLHKTIPFSNLSILIRHILFKEKIPVRVANIELANLEYQLSVISSNIERILKSKREENKVLKPIMEIIKKEVSGIQKKVIPHRDSNLLLTDLREFEKSEKEQDHYYLKYTGRRNYRDYM